jgi:hypothetical protein
LHEWNRHEPFAQLPQLFQNNSGRRFQDVSAGCGEFFQEPRVGRGVAVADFDRDGAADVAITHLNGLLSLLHNETPQRGGWLAVDMIGTRSNRDAVGAVVAIQVGQRTLRRCRQAGGSYLSCDESRLLVGIGDASQVDRITVHWPGSVSECWDNLPINATYRLREGTGREIAAE